MGGGPMNDLAQRLSAAAEEAADTDYEALRARVFATSRRLGRRRRVVAAGAVLALGGAVAGGVGLVAAADGKVTPLSGADWGFFAWSNNGAYRAYLSALPSAGIVVARPDGTVLSDTPLRYWPGCPEPPAAAGCGSVLAVSDDGRYV